MLLIVSFCVWNVIIVKTNVLNEEWSLWLWRKKNIINETDENEMNKCQSIFFSQMF